MDRDQVRADESETLPQSWALGMGEMGRSPETFLRSSGHIL